MDIDRFFTLGPAAPFQVHEVFTNREGPLSVFRQRAASHAAQKWDTGQLMDFQRSASNLLTYVGLGGIGKSTFLHRAARVALEGDLPHPPGRVATAVVNFADPETHSFETVLLRVRTGLGQLGRTWFAFDLAFALYWERKHPGESLVAFLRRTNSEDGVSARVADQITNAVDQLAGGFGAVGLGYQLLSAVGRRTVRHSRLRRITQELPAFEALINERDPDRMLGYLPILLAWDLEQHRSKETTLALCLLDTFEHIQAMAAERGGPEDLIARLVYLMPNVLFLASSRRPLAWHDPVRASVMTYGGPHRWPGLRTAEEGGVYGPSGDQVHLDGFDEVNSDQYLRCRLTRNGQVAIPRQFRRRIIEGSVGSPHYLELSAALFEQISARGGVPDEDLFGLPFPELVIRLMRDLDSEDRDLLRAAALLPAFDAETLSAVLPLVRRRRIEDFLGRAVVLTDEAAWPAHRLHENLRRSITACDDHTPDGWTAGERRSAALRAVDHLAQLALDEHRSGQRRAGGQDDQRAVTAFLLGLRAAGEHRISPPRLGQLGYALYELGHWQVLAGLPLLPEDAPADLQRLAATAEASARSDVDARSRYERLSRRHAERPSSDDPYAAYTEVTLGNLAFFHGDLAAAEEHFSAALGQPAPLGSDARLGIIGVALRTSRFSEPLGRAERAPVSDVSPSGFADALGHLELHNGRFDLAASHFTRALSNARSVRAPLWIARGSRHLALASMWLDPESAAAVLPEAREVNTVLGDVVGTAQCDLVGALLQAHRGLWDDAERMVARARQMLDAAGVTFDLLPVEVVETLLLAARGNHESATALARRIAEASAAGHPLGPPVWTAVTSLWTEQEDLHSFDAIDWLQPATARARWLAPLIVLRERQERAGS